MEILLLLKDVKGVDKLIDTYLDSNDIPSLVFESKHEFSLGEVVEKLREMNLLLSDKFYKSIFK
jgi:hypothetical protein